MPTGLFIKAQSSDTAFIAVVGEIGRYTDENNSVSFSKKVDQLIQAGVRNVIGYVSSIGGECFEANEMKLQIKKFPGSKILYVGSIIASAATDYSLAFDEVCVVFETMYMIHPPSAFVGGTAKQMGSTINLLNLLTDQYVKGYAQKTGLSEDKIREMMEAETWMDSKTALALGFVDKIVDSIPVDLEYTEDYEDVYASLNKFGYKNTPVSVTAKLKPDTKTKDDTMNKAKMLAILMAAGITMPSDSTDAQIEAAFERIAQENKTLKASLDEEKGKTAKSRAKMLCDKLKDEKKITDAEYDQTLSDATMNYEGVERAYAKVPAVTAASRNLGKTETSNDNKDTSNARADWDFDKWTKEDPKGLEKMHAEKSEAFVTLFKAKFGKAPW